MRQVDVSDVAILAGLVAFGAAVYLLAGPVGLLAYIGVVLMVFGLVRMVNRDYEDALRRIRDR